MLVTDSDRAAYPRQYARLSSPGVPALFLFENYRENFYSGDVKTLDDWINITGESDYTTPRPRTVKAEGRISPSRYRFCRPAQKLAMAT